MCVLVIRPLGRIRCIDDRLIGVQRCLARLEIAISSNWILTMLVRRRRYHARQSAKFDYDDGTVAATGTDYAQRILYDKADQQFTRDRVSDEGSSVRREKTSDEKDVTGQEDPVKGTMKTRIRISFEIDLVAVILLAGGLATRLYRLEEPRSIVFDELHYGNYVGLYMKRTFFFDSHPPLGKQLISGAAYLAGFDGQFKFDRIGSPYAETVPLFALRLVPALCGSLLIPTAYHLALELGLKQWSAAIAGLLLLFDNALLTQSRFVLMESILMQFSLFGLLCIMKFRRVMDQPTSVMWWIWLIIGTASLTCALCVKYVGFYSLALAVFLIVRDYWSLIRRKTLSGSMLCVHLLTRIAVVAVVTTAVYLSVFYVHLAVLSKAGPHDSGMTSAFQASLEGGLASITRGQPIEVTHGSQITLRHTYGRTCWLHSHNHVYPLRYPDSRGSSHQQQVTCYSFKDVNNWWIVKKPDKNDLVVTKPSEPIRHGDVIQLVHGITKRALNSHDVAAPMTPQSQEVACYIDYNVSMPAQNLWRVEIANKENAGDVWHAIQSQVRLVHVSTTYALTFSGRQLPDWGFNQHEVVACRLADQTNSIWNVEEHRYTKSEDAKERERELINAEMIPLKATTLSFWEKFLELQLKMLFGGQERQNTHMYSSGPLEWPLMTRGIAYWVSNESNAQIHLLGNVVIWYSGTIAVTTYSILLSFYLLRRRRMSFDITEFEWSRFVNIGGVLLAGYLLHFLPFMFVERILFWGGTVLLFFCSRSKYKSKLSLHILKCAAVTWIFLVIFVFRRFIVLSHGTAPLSAKDVLKLRWRDTWDFIVHKT